MTAANGKIRRPVSERDIREYEKAWTEMMVTIWRENMLRLQIFDTGKLYNRITGRVQVMDGMVTISHQFLLYGIYVARGVGNGYRRGNSGKDDENGLRFLGKDYRKKHKMGAARKKRDWFYRRYMSSIAVLSRVERDLYGEAYMGTLSDVVQAMFGNGSVKSSSGKDVSGTFMSF